MSLKIFASATSALLLTLSHAAAAPAQPIGSAVTVVNLVTAELDRDTRTLQSGDKVHQDENIDVGADASGEIKLDDDTKLALGPGSRLKLDKFVYDPAKSGGSIVLNLAKGTFRFITGVATKPAYVIRTPSASITVRGTIFDVFVQDDGLTWLLLHEGSVQACNDRGRCQVLDEPGKLIRVTEDGDVGAPVKWAALPGKDSTPFDTAFPFVVNAPGIDPNPIFTRDVIILGNLPERDTPKETEPDTSKKKTERTKEIQKQATTKKTRAAKKGSSDDSNIVSGMDIVIGVGVGAMGRHGGHMDGHKSNNSDMPRTNSK